VQARRADRCAGRGWLAGTPAGDDWRQGRVDYLERVVQAGLGNISTAMMDQLILFASADAALTRRAKRASRLSAVRFSRARGAPTSTKDPGWHRARGGALAPLRRHRHSASACSSAFSSTGHAPHDIVAHTVRPSRRLSSAAKRGGRQAGWLEQGAGCRANSSREKAASATGRVRTLAWVWTWGGHAERSYATT
jgi:hypothetical protein